MRLCNCSVTASMCLQVQCFLCCYYSFELAGPVGWTCGGIDFVIVQITRVKKKTGVGLMGESGWRWAEIHQVLCTFSLDRVTSFVKYRKRIRIKVLSDLNMFPGVMFGLGLPSKQV